MTSSTYNQRANSLHTPAFNWIILHDDGIQWKNIPHYRPVEMGNHQPFLGSTHIRPVILGFVVFLFVSRSTVLNKLSHLRWSETLWLSCIMCLNTMRFPRRVIPKANDKTLVNLRLLIRPIIHLSLTVITSYAAIFGVFWRLDIETFEISHDISFDRGPSGGIIRCIPQCGICYCQ